MTPRQISKLIEWLQDGKTLEQALRSCRVPMAKYEQAIAEDPELERTIREASTVTTIEPLPPPPPPAPVAVAEPDPTQDEPEEIPEVPLLDKAKIGSEAAALAPGMFGYLLWVDARCVAIGMPALSPWWRFAISGFYASEKRWGLFRVGRGGGKSTSLTRVAATEGEFAERSVPPGQRWVWPFISINTEDANKRIDEIQTVLTAIGLEPEIKRPNGHPTIAITDVNKQSIAYVSLAGSISSVSGPNTIGATIDEEAKLRNRNSSANPAIEILASLVNTFRAREGIRAIRCSSAWNSSGTHFDSIAEGDTSSNYVAKIGEPFLALAVEGLLHVAEYEQSTGNKSTAEKIRLYARNLTALSPNVPTWVANPTISALASRLEINALPITKLGGLSRTDYWLRENASLPFGAAIATSADLEALAAMNRRIIARTDSQDPALMQFDGLLEFDPRSRGYGTPGNSL